MNVSDNKIFNTMMNLAAFVVIVAGMKAASSLIVPFLMAFFLVIMCMPLLANFEKTKVPFAVSLTLIILIILGLWLALLFFLGATLGEFTKSLPLYQERLGILNNQIYTWLTAHDIPANKSLFHSIFDPSRILKLVTTTMNSLVAILKNVFFILLLFAFLTAEASGIPRKIEAISSNGKEALTSYYAIVGSVNKYLGIKSITSLLTGAFVYIGLVFLEVDFPFLWAVLSFILNFIPTIGSLIAAVPAIILSLVQLGPASALGTAILYLLVNTCIGSIAEPKIMGQRIGLSTIVVLLSLVFWGWVLGPIGMLLSVPLTMTVKIGLAQSESTKWLSILLAPNSEVSRLAGKTNES